MPPGKTQLLSPGLSPHPRRPPPRKVGRSATTFWEGYRVTGALPIPIPAQEGHGPQLAAGLVATRDPRAGAELESRGAGFQRTERALAPPKTKHSGWLWG